MFLCVLFRDPKLAMHYLAMIPESEARVDAIVNLATETREYRRQPHYMQMVVLCTELPVHTYNS